MTLRIPKTLGAKADLAYKLRTERLLLQRKVDEKKLEEMKLNESILDGLRQHKLDAARGKLATVTRSTVLVAKVQDWAELYAYIKKTGSFELLHKRLSDTAFRELWEDDKKVPGVGAESVVKLSLTKAGR